MTQSNPTPDPLDLVILKRLEQIENASNPNGSASRPQIPNYPKPQSAVPLFNLNEPDGSEATDQREFLEHEAADISHTASHRIKCKHGDVWLSGTTLLCACPDCLAPMTIRAWLRLADCWRCNSSVSLTEEQIRAVRQLADIAPPPTPRVQQNSAKSKSPVELPFPEDRKTKADRLGAGSRGRALPPPPPATNQPTA